VIETIMHYADGNLLISHQDGGRVDGWSLDWLPSSPGSQGWRRQDHHPAGEVMGRQSPGRQRWWGYRSVRRQSEIVCW
jgi:hypothetical protein